VFAMAGAGVDGRLCDAHGEQRAASLVVADWLTRAAERCVIPRDGRRDQRTLAPDWDASAVVRRSSAGPEEGGRCSVREPPA
jgi:hypothetical protein